MGKLKTLGQKMGAKAQQLKGEIEVASGKPVKGNLNMLKGKAKEIAADIKMKVDNS